MSSCADQNIDSDTIIHSSDCETSYSVSSVYFSGGKSSICCNVYTDYLKSPSTPHNGAINSIISGVTTTFLFNNIEPNDPQVINSTQFQFSKPFLIIQFHLKEKT